MEVVRNNSQEIKTGEMAFSSEYISTKEDAVAKKIPDVLDQIEHFKFIDKNIHDTIEHVK